MDTRGWNQLIAFFVDRAGFRRIFVCSFILCRKLARLFTSFFKSISPLGNLFFCGQVSGVFLYAHSFYAGILPQPFFYTYLLLLYFSFPKNNNNNLIRIIKSKNRAGGLGI